ncbi:hypothetical protein [Micromonospora sp. NPDC005979]|uniref:hypothetical protein n=1 Tax=Micromonospora sp. NPDC005979 TaxID=3156726 RepID=UPI0033B9E183
MSDETSNRPSRSAERPDDVTDPLLWQLAVDVLEAHEADDEGHCRNLQCAGQSWPCAARTTAEQSLRLARSTSDSVETAIDGGGRGTGWPAEAAAPAQRWGWNGDVMARREARSAASAA